jgi:hypothetical protein
MKTKLTALQTKMARDRLYLTSHAPNFMLIPLWRVSWVGCLSYGVDMALPLDSTIYLLVKAGMMCSQRSTPGSQHHQSLLSTTLLAHLAPTPCSERRSISRTPYFLMIASMQNLTQDAHQRQTLTLHANTILCCITSYQAALLSLGTA